MTIDGSAAHSVLSMDPHSLLEALQISFTGNVYEPLVGRDKQTKLVPLLATEWSQTSPTTWRFKLRRGVTFTTARRSQPTMWCSRSGARWATALI